MPVRPNETAPAPAAPAGSGPGRGASRAPAPSRGARLQAMLGRRRVTWGLLVVLLLVVVATIDPAALLAAVRAADGRWILASAAVALTTYVGGGLTLAAFSPERRVGVTVAAAVQAAARPVAVVAPAGLGPAAVNLRFLTRRSISTPSALATVAAVQVCQLVVTVVALVVLTLATGMSTRLSGPPPVYMWVAAGAVVAAGIVALVPAVRALVARWVGPLLEQARPRLTWLAQHPGRIALGALGSLVLTAGYVLAFSCALAAFDQHLPLAQVAATYLLGSAAGSLVPTPGGVGPVEAALTGGLTLAGVPVGIAVPVAVVFRLATHWLQLPLGWLVLTVLRRTGDL